MFDVLNRTLFLDHAGKHHFPGPSEDPDGNERRGSPPGASDGGPALYGLFDWVSPAGPCRHPLTGRAAAGHRLAGALLCPCLQICLGKPLQALSGQALRIGQPDPGHATPGSKNRRDVHHAGFRVELTAGEFERDTPSPAGNAGTHGHCQTHRLIANLTDAHDRTYRQPDRGLRLADHFTSSVQIVAGHMAYPTNHSSEADRICGGCSRFARNPPAALPADRRKVQTT